MAFYESASSQPPQKATTQTGDRGIHRDTNHGHNAVFLLEHGVPGTLQGILDTEMANLEGTNTRHTPAHTHNEYVIISHTNIPQHVILGTHETSFTLHSAPRKSKSWKTKRNQSKNWNFNAK